MNRFRLILILPLLTLLLLAQQGATLHELSHLRCGSRPPPSQPLTGQPPAAEAAGAQPLALQVSATAALPAGNRCLTCQAFAQIAHPASGFIGWPLIKPAAKLRSPDLFSSVAGRDAPAPRSRGPPQG